MNLRLTTLLLVAITFAGLSLVLSMTTRAVLVRHFEETEQQSMRINLERAQAAVEAEFVTLEALAGEWSGRAAGGELPAPPDTLAALDVDLLAKLDPDARLVDGVFMPEDGLQPLQLEQGQLPAELLLPALAAGQTRAVIAYHGLPLLLLGRSVSGGQEGTAGGWLLAGRLLDAAALERLGRLVQLPVELLPYEAAAGAPDLEQGTADGSAGFVQVLDKTRIAGYSLLTGFDGQPSFLVRIEQSRLSSLSGQRVISLISAALIVVGIVFAVITILFLELLVTARLSRLGREVNAIRASGSLTRRVTVSRRDELAELGMDINAMLDALELSQAHRQEAQNELSARIADLQTLNDSAVTLLGRLEAPNTREMVCRLAVEQFGVDLAWIGAPSRDRAWLQPAAAFGCPLVRIEPLPLGEGTAVQQALAEAQPALCAGPVTCAGESWAVHAALPLPVEPDQLAVLNLYRRECGFTPQSLQILEAFTNLASVALQNVLLFHQVRNGRKRLELLSRRLVDMQEEERKRIAMELHDEIGQILTGLNLMLTIDSAEMQPGQLENARKLVNDLIGRVRQMSLTLRPAMLDDLGLLPTLLWHFENYTRQTGIRVQFQHEALEGERFSPEIETAVYRVTQEALTNVARHAGVDEVLVQIWVSEDILSLQVEDEGKGFDAEGPTATTGRFGLLGMQERAISLRGSLMIESSSGRGVILLLQLPLRGALERRSYGRDHSAGG